MDFFDGEIEQDKLTLESIAEALVVIYGEVVVFSHKDFTAVCLYLGQEFDISKILQSIRYVVTDSALTS